MTNEELLHLLNNRSLVVSKLSAKEWRGFLFDLLKSHPTGEVLVMTRSVYETTVWNESLAMSWLQLLEGLKFVQRNWVVLTTRCPELLEDSIMSRLYTSEALKLASKSDRYLPPDNGSVGDLILELMEKAIGPITANCGFCGTGEFVSTTFNDGPTVRGPMFCFPLK
ncbi:MAG: hypothetical protein ACON4U_02010 [Myxococcota bacterium]